MKTAFLTVMTLCLLPAFPVKVFAAVQSGGGFNVDGQINAAPGVVSGGTYRSVVGAHPTAQKISGNGYSVYGGISHVTFVQSQSPAPTPQGGGGGGGGGGSQIPVLGLVDESSLPTDQSSDLIISARAKSIDIVKDGIVNILDFNSLMVNWGKGETENDADMNQDGAVDILDFNLLMVYWGTSYQL